MQQTLQSLFQVTEVDLIYRNKNLPKPQVNSSSAVYDILSQSWDRNKIELLEEFKILLLNRGNYILGISLISTGGMSGCIADPKIIFATALKGKASSIILAHNHPSGNLKASQADILLTKKLVNAGDMLDIPVLDHFILSATDYLSFADQGMMPSPG